MSTEQEKLAEDRPVESETEGETIDSAFLQMEILYKTRCVQSPFGRNVTVREIKEEE